MGVMKRKERMRHHINAIKRCIFMSGELEFTTSDMVDNLSTFFDDVTRERVEEFLDRESEALRIMQIGDGVWVAYGRVYENILKLKPPEGRA